MLNKIIYEPWIEENKLDILDYFQYHYQNISLGIDKQQTANRSVIIVKVPPTDLLIHNNTVIGKINITTQNIEDTINHHFNTKSKKKSKKKSTKKSNKKSKKKT